jgi:hypothetical protein
LATVAGAAYVKFTKHGQTQYKDWVYVATTANEVRQNPNLIFDQAGSDHVNILLIGRDVNWKETKVYDPTTKQFAVITFTTKNPAHAATR